MTSPAKESAPIQVNVAYFRQNLQRLLKDVQQGKTVVISRYNKPVAVISPAPAKPETKGVRRLGTGKGRIRIIDPHWADPMTDQEVDTFLEGRY